MTSADDDGTRDWMADYEGEGREWAANNNSIRARRAESVKKKMSLCKKTFFSDTVCAVGFFAPAKNTQSVVLDLSVLSVAQVTSVANT